jgi:hypothetical protein
LVEGLFAFWAIVGLEAFQDVHTGFVEVGVAYLSAEYRS